MKWKLMVLFVVGSLFVVPSTVAADGIFDDLPFGDEDDQEHEEIAGSDDAFESSSQVELGNRTIRTNVTNVSGEVNSEYGITEIELDGSSGFYFISGDGIGMEEVEAENVYVSGTHGHEYEANDTEWVALQLDGDETIRIFSDDGPVDFDIDDDGTQIGDFNFTSINRTVEFGDDRFEIDEDIEDRELPENLTRFRQNWTDSTMVEDSQVNTTNITLDSYSSSNVTFLIENSNNSSTTFYIRQERVLDAFNKSSMDNVTLELDDERVPYTTTQQNNSTWVAYTVDHFSTREVSFQNRDVTTQATGGSTSDGPNLLLFGGIGVAIITVLGGFIYIRQDKETKYV